MFEIFLTGATKYYVYKKIKTTYLIYFWNRWTYLEQWPQLPNLLAEEFHLGLESNLSDFSTKFKDSDILYYYPNFFLLFPHFITLSIWFPSWKEKGSKNFLEVLGIWQIYLLQLCLWLLWFYMESEVLWLEIWWKKLVLLKVVEVDSVNWIFIWLENRKSDKP